MASSDSDSESMSAMDRRQKQIELRMLEQRATKVELDNKSKQLANQQKEQSLRSKEADENRKRYFAHFPDVTAM